MTGKRTQISTPGSPTSGTDFHGSSKDQDRLLPIANVGRIMKKSLPSNAKISKEAKEMVQECVSDFINFITGEASDKCQREKRKTINGEDLLWAMTTLGFQNYVGSLKTYLNKYVGSSSDSPCDASVNEIGSEAPNWTSIQPTSEGSHDPYHERVTRYGDDLINMVKLHDTKTVAMTHGQEFEW